MSNKEKGKDKAADKQLVSSYKEEEDYDPYKHRKIKHPTTYWESLTHLVKGVLGTGILAMPQGFSKAGLIPGLIISVLATLLFTHCMRVLIQQEYQQAKLSRVPYLEYRDAAAWSLRRGPGSLRKYAKCSAIVVDFFLGFYHFGVCCIYVLFIAGSLEKMVNINVVWCILYIALPLIAMNMVPNLKYLAPFSMLANILTIVGLLIVVVCVTMWPAKSTSNLDLWGSVAQYPLYFGTVLFALAAVGVLVAIENNMKHPEQFCPRLGVLNVGMSSVAALYIIVAVLAYNYCRDKCSDVITLDMPQNSWMEISVLVLFSIAIYISYGLNAYVPVNIIFRYVQNRMSPDSSEKKLFIANYVVRLIVSLLTFVVSAAVPQIGLFISLFGAFCLSTMGIIIPMLMEALSSPKRPIFYKDIFIMIIGLGVLVTGTFTSVENIVRTFSDPKSKSDALVGN